MEFGAVYAPHQQYRALTIWLEPLEDSGNSKT